jgi:aminoglycoside phosphotransferase (APT) family kinase protein
MFLFAVLRLAGAAQAGTAPGGGRSDLPVGGFGRREDLYAAYEAAGGAPVGRNAGHWWEVFGTLRWGTMCAGSLTAFRQADPTLERGMIARRTSKTEIDLPRHAQPSSMSRALVSTWPSKPVTSAWTE